MNTLQELKTKVADMELAAVEFLTAKGKLARKRRKIATAEFTFIDGEKLVLPRAELDSFGFDLVTFRLRPGKDHA